MTRRPPKRSAARPRTKHRPDGSHYNGQRPSELLRCQAKSRSATDQAQARNCLLAAADLIDATESVAGTAAGPTNVAQLIAALFQRAVENQNAGRNADAEAVYRAILVLDTSHAMVWSNLSVILISQGAFDDAIKACETALRLTPDHLNAQLNLASALLGKRDFSAAADIYRKILSRHPRRSDLWKTLGSVLEQAGRNAEALEAYDAMIAIEPSDATSFVSKAEALKKLDRIDEALASYREAIRLKPDDALGLSSMGILMAMHSLSNDLDEAANLCVRAAILQPNNAAIVNNLGVILQIRNDTDNALLVLRQLTVQEPNFAPAYSNIGSILSAKSRYDEAEDAFLRALELDPSLTEAQIELTKVRRHLCNWDYHEADAATIRSLKGHGTNFMIVLMAVSSSGHEQLSYARSAMAKYNRSTVRVGPYRNAFDPRRLRIGYISADFREHPVGRLMPDVIAAHDRQRFEVFGYSLGPGDQTLLRYRLASSFDRFVDFNRLSDAQAAAQIHDDGIDILVDLTGPTAGSRYDILAQRPAPVQVSFLGLPGTAGADCIDYIIADSFLAPPGHDAFFHEKLVRLPGCYQPSDTSRRLLSPLPSRIDCGLPETGFVFCSFNSPVKITPEVFDTWMRLLHAVDGSVLWLYCKAERTKANLLARAAHSGIGPERLIFAGLGHYDIYLTRMVCADLFLDTFPYAAGATCNDALWAGLPVLTRIGETYVSRMAGSLLTALGLDELVTRTLDEYEQVALRLANDPTKLEELKARLASGIRSAPLFDMRSFTASLETSYSKMAALAANGYPPVALDLC